MQSMCILLDDQYMEWKTCERYMVINWLSLCGCEWCECQIYVNGVNVGYICEWCTC